MLECMLSVQNLNGKSMDLAALDQSWLRIMMLE